MIPNFKTYLRESVWGDLRKKSLGQEVREESNVDNLDQLGFYEYLRNRYKPQISVPITISSGILNRPISIPLLCFGDETYYLYIQETTRRDYAYMYIRQKDIYPEFLDDLDLEYDIKLRDSGRPSDDKIQVRISPKKNRPEELPNSFYVKLIDYILDMDKGFENAIERVVEESVWGDLRKKSLGQEERLENNINDLNFEQMLDYLEDTYEYDDDAVTEINRNGNISGVSVCIVHLGKNSLFDLYIDYQECMDSDDREMLIPSEALEKMPDRYSELEDKYYNLYDELNKEYNIYKKSDWDGTTMYAIAPKHGDVDNKFFLEVLYFIINNVDKPILKKR